MEEARKDDIQEITSENSLKEKAFHSHLPLDKMSSLEMQSFSDIQGPSSLAYIQIRNRILKMCFDNPGKQLTEYAVQKIEAPYNEDEALLLRTYEFLERHGFINYGINASMNPLLNPPSADTLEIKQDPDKIQHHADELPLGLNGACSLYQDHQIKEENAIGPTVLQEPIWSYSNLENTKRKPQETQIYFVEVPLDPDGSYSQHRNHQIKEEMVIGSAGFLQPIDLENTKRKPQETQIYFVEVPLDPDGAYSLHQNHQTKEEMVIGSTGFLQPTDTQQIERDLNRIQQHVNELPLEGACSLYEDHQVKEEMVIGPTVLHKSTNVYLSSVMMKKNKLYNEEGTEKQPEVQKIWAAENVYKFGQHNTPNITIKHVSDSELPDVSVSVDQRTYTEEKPFPCNLCFKSFDEKYRLDIHRRTHTGDKPFSCVVCLKSFNEQYRLDIHLRTHTGEKPFSCDVCCKSFSQKYVLDSHQRVHTGERPFSCDVCHKSFIRRNALNHHRRKHTGEKPFSCVKQSEVQKISAAENIYEFGQHNTSNITMKPVSDSELPDVSVSVDIKHDVSKKPVATLSEVNINKTAINDPNPGKRTDNDQEPSLENHQLLRSYDCVVCDKIFSKKSDLDRHRRTHTEEKPFPCNVCFKSFDEKYRLDIHRRTHTGDNPFSCVVCFKSFNEQYRLDIHLRTHTGEKPFSCDVCCKSFSLKYGLDSHQRIHTGERPFSCDVCHKSFIRRNDLDQHRRKHTGEKPFSCVKQSEVQKISTAEDVYKFGLHNTPNITMKPVSESELPDVSVSVDIKHDVSKKSVNTLSEVNINKSALNDSNPGTRTNNDQERSLERHQRLRTYDCVVCHKNFNQKSDLNRHQRIHTGEKPFSCDVCFKSFNEKYRLHIHRRTHTGDKPFSCVVCCKSFNEKYRLDKHLRTHTGEKPFSCDVCCKSFSQKYDLNSHRRIHTGEKLFSCDLCQKRFAKKCHLDRHRQSHTGVKPYFCDVCEKRFGRKCHLDRHRQSHTGVKPYFCDVCNKSFIQRNALDQHRRIHTGEKPFSCVKQSEVQKISAAENVYEFGQHNTPNITMKPVSDSELPDVSVSVDIKHDLSKISVATLSEVNINKTAINDPNPGKRTDNDQEPSLEKHQRLRSYDCVVCDKIFSKKSDLDRHRRIHTEEKPFPCKVCQKRFGRKCDLDRHRQTHTGVKSYVCDVCNKAFTRKIGIIIHQRIHTGERPFSCDVCHKSFIQRNALDQHRRIHTGEKPFSCDVCHKGFISKSNLVSHLRIHNTQHTGENIGCLAHRVPTHFETIHEKGNLFLSF